jgi:hypothetical protein
MTNGTLVETTFTAGRVIAGPMPEDGDPSRRIIVEGPTLAELYRGAADTLERLVPDLRAAADEHEKAAAEQDAQGSGTEGDAGSTDGDAQTGSGDVSAAETRSRAKHPTACCKDQAAEGGALVVGAFDPAATIADGGPAHAAAVDAAQVDCTAAAACG